MRYVVSGIFALAALWFVNSTIVDIGSLSRPYPAMVISATLLVTFFITLLVWELVAPSEDHSERDARLREEERQRRTRRDGLRAEQRPDEAGE